MRVKLLLALWCFFAAGFNVAAQQPGDSQKIILTAPNNGETYKVGDTITVTWVCIDDIMFVDIRVSPDGGKTWILVNGSSIKYNDAVSWYHYKWVIPEKIRENNMPDAAEFSLADNHTCLIRVENYSPVDQTEISICAKPLTILAGSGVITPFRHAGRTTATVVREGSSSVHVFDLRGRVVSPGSSGAAGLAIGVIPGVSPSARKTGKTAYLR